MSLPSNGSLSLSEINKSVRFTNGNVGLGTVTPSSKLDMYDATQTDINLRSTTAQTRILSFNDTKTYFQSSGDIAFTGIDTTTLRHLYLATNGNVGIGTTSPQVKLHVAGSSLFGTSSGDVIGANLFWNGTTWTRGNANAFGFVLRIGTTSDIYGNGLQTFTMDTVSGMRTDTFMVGANGSVGIGTINPAQRLEVFGGRIRVSRPDAVSAVYQLTNTSGTAYLFNNPSGNVHMVPISNIILNADEAGTQYGTVGICTSNPNSSVKLHVNGSILLSSGGSLWIAGTEDQGTNRFRFHNFPGWASAIDFVGGSLFIRSGVGTPGTLITLTTAGNLGIGTSPMTRLTINGNTNIEDEVLAISASSSGTTSSRINLGTSGTRDGSRSAIIYTTDSNEFAISNQEPGFVQLSTNNGINGSIRLTSAGNLCINTTTDRGRLHVTALTFPNIMLTPGLSGNAVTLLEYDSSAKTGGKLWRLMSTHQDASEGQGKFIITNATDSRIALALLPEVGRAGIGTVNPSPHNGLHVLSGEFQLGPNNSNAFHMHANGSGNLYYYSGSWGTGTLLGYWYNNGLVVSGALSKSSGTFDIKHPLHPNDENNRLVHSFIEGPRCDLIYRGQVTLTNGTATVNLDTDCVAEGGSEMSPGTFEALCTNPQFFLQNMNAFSGVKGNIQGRILTIECEDVTSTDTIYWTVIAERKDNQIKSWERTNANGYLKTEYIAENYGGSIPTKS